mmetsp:Transcript_2342/g.6306  ORF Transcript_2342/g.6306 Transcript_2342/m.6306 type:complete len:200 (+) Transcript_2342:379-978(+)
MASAAGSLGMRLLAFLHASPCALDRTAAASPPGPTRVSQQMTPSGLAPNRAGGAPSFSCDTTAARTRSCGISSRPTSTTTAFGHISSTASSAAGSCALPQRHATSGVPTAAARTHSASWSSDRRWCPTRDADVLGRLFPLCATTTWSRRAFKFAETLFFSSCCTSAFARTSSSRSLSSRPAAAATRGRWTSFCMPEFGS